MIPALLIEFTKNYTALTAGLAWLFTQTIKVLLGVIRERRFNFMWLIGTGGLPSAHAAGVTALATTIGLHQGFQTPIFALALFFCIIVVFDAQGVRRASGQQAEILNKILEDIYWKRKMQEDRLKELLGHTPMEVLTGAAIGILISMLCYKGRLY